jgi:hypothetical protein
MSKQSANKGDKRKAHENRVLTVLRLNSRLTGKKFYDCQTLVFVSRSAGRNYDANPLTELGVPHYSILGWTTFTPHHARVYFQRSWLTAQSPDPSARGLEFELDDEIATVVRAIKISIPIL